MKLIPVTVVVDNAVKLSLTVKTSLVVLNKKW